MSAGIDHDAAWDTVTAWYGRDGVAAACLDLQDEHGVDVVALLACTWAAMTTGRADPDLYDELLDDGWSSGVVQPLRSLRRSLSPGTGGSNDVRRAVADAEVQAEHEQFRRHLARVERRGGFEPTGAPSSSAVVAQLAAIARRTTGVPGTARSGHPSAALAVTMAVIARGVDPTLDQATVVDALGSSGASARAGTTDRPAAPWRVACLQLASPSDEALDDRVVRVIDEIEKVAQTEHPDAIVLPELWTTGFFHFDRYAAEAQPIDGAIVTALADVAAAQSVWLFGGSFVEAGTGARRHNTSVCIDPDGNLAARYRKVHLFGYESAEARTLTPGTEPVVVDTPVGRVGLATCYDLRFPELFRRLVDAGAEVFVVASAWPAARRDHWELLLRARAVENLAWVVACNAAGEQAGTSLAGASSVISPWGDVLASAGDRPEVLVADVDPAVTARYRTDFPSLTDRRRLPAALTMR